MYESFPYELHCLNKFSPALMSWPSPMFTSKSFELLLPGHDFCRLIFCHVDLSCPSVLHWAVRACLVGLQRQLGFQSRWAVLGCLFLVSQYCPTGDLPTCTPVLLFSYYSHFIMIFGRVNVISFHILLKSILLKLYRLWNYLMLDVEWNRKAYIN